MSELHARPGLVVAAAIVDDLATPRRLLAARRSAPEELAGGWELPGGKVEPGETPEAALHREVREELGVSIAAGAEVTPPEGRAWPLSGATGSAGALELRVWRAVVVDGTPEPLADHDLVCWLAPGAWETVAWLPADTDVVAALVGRR